MDEHVAELCRVPGCHRAHIASHDIPLCHAHHEIFLGSSECARWMAIHGCIEHLHWLSALDVHRCGTAVMDFVRRFDREANALTELERAAFVV